MNKRILAVVAMIGLLLAGAAATASADASDEKNCERSKAYGCDDHPGDHTDDDDGGEGPSTPELSCDGLSAVAQELADGCNGVVNPEPGPSPEPGAPSCDDLSAVAQELADGCNGVVNPEPGPSPEPGAPTCDDIPSIEPTTVDPIVDEVCAALGG